MKFFFWGGSGGKLAACHVEVADMDHVIIALSWYTVHGTRYTGVFFGTMLVFFSCTNCTISMLNKQGCLLFFDHRVTTYILYFISPALLNNVVGLGFRECVKLSKEQWYNQ